MDTPSWDTIENLEMQGTVLAGLKCSISIDTFGKECLENVHDVLYNYKESAASLMTLLE